MTCDRAARGVAFLLFVLFGLLIPLSGCRSIRANPAQPTPLVEEPTARVYRQVEGKPLTAHVFSPSRKPGRPVPAILLFHGGGWAAGSPEWTFGAARRFHALGLVAMSIEYRLSEGEVTPIEALADVCAAFKWAREHADELDIDPDRIAGYGVSAGGHLVAAAATLGCGVPQGSCGLGGPDALILWSPALDVAADGWFRKLLQGRAEVSAYSPLENVRSMMPPTSIVHGAKDTLTPLRAAERFCNAITAAGGRCELNVYEGVGHLLTRNLGHQESDFDPDPEARDDGYARQNRFVQELWPVAGR